MSDRWRYCCPYGHRHVTTRTKLSKEMGRPGRIAQDRFFCDSCESPYPKVWDLKQKTWVTSK